MYNPIMDAVAEASRRQFHKCVMCGVDAVIIDGDDIYCTWCDATYGDDESNPNTIYVRAIPNQVLLDESAYVEALTGGAGAIR